VDIGQLPTPDCCIHFNACVTLDLQEPIAKVGDQQIPHGTTDNLDVLHKQPL
jgi:hypothetical protein